MGKFHRPISARVGFRPICIATRYAGVVLLLSRKHDSERQYRVYIGACAANDSYGDWNICCNDGDVVAENAVSVSRPIGVAWMRLAVRRRGLYAKGWTKSRRQPPVEMAASTLPLQANART